MKSSTKPPAPHNAKARPDAPVGWNRIIPKRAPAAVLAPPDVPMKWRWHHHVLVSLHDRLLRERADRLEASAEPLEPHSLHEADSAADEIDHDLALTQLSAGQDALSEVNDALRRLQNGTYGVCEATGRAIPPARLRAVPWTRFTLEAETRREQRAGRVGTRLRRAATVRSRSQLPLIPEAGPEETDAAPTMTANDEALSPVEPPGRQSSPAVLRLQKPSTSTTKRHATR